MTKTGSPEDGEESMLDLNPERQANSRLSCQITVTEDLDGLVVDLPEFQF
jgi:2Fe-2S ferredoxin